MFKQLKIYYFFISLPFIMLIAGATIFFDAIMSTIDRNPHPQINYSIFVIILFGGCIILLNARRLIREARSLSTYVAALGEKVESSALQKIAAAATGEIASVLQMMSTSCNRAISHQEQAAVEHELANAKTCLIRRNALPQYLTGLLVGMGLLGTFIGLLATLSDISALISSFAGLDMSTADPILVFSNMIERMKAPMQSMSIAFSASMFGLLGSIILGLMMVGTRRLQGDIFSVLSSQVARHIENALSFESVSLSNRDVKGANQGADIPTKVLLRIEERLAESSRQRQRALSTEIDDFRKQRAEMLQALTEQTDANRQFHSSLEKLGEQFVAAIEGIKSNNGEIAAQVSDQTVQLSGNAKESLRLLGQLVEEQKALRETLGANNIEARLAETGRIHQRVLSGGLEELKKQREEMLRVLAEQGEAKTGFRRELRQLCERLDVGLGQLEKNNNGITEQLSEMTVQMNAEAKESQILLGQMNGNLQQFSALVSLAEKGNSEICAQLAQLSGQMAGDAKESRKLFVNVSNYFRGELQQLGSKKDEDSSAVPQIGKKEESYA